MMPTSRRRAIHPNIPDLRHGIRHAVFAEHTSRSEFRFQLFDDDSAARCRKLSPASWTGDPLRCCQSENLKLDR